jgi:RNA polymerase I-specific transcription initiation factor RRN3
VLEFSCNLVVANAAFAHTCIQLLIYSLTPPPGPRDPNDPSQDPHGPWQPSQHAAAVHQAVLEALTRVLSLVPTAASNVLPTIVAQMPHKLRDRNTQCLYLSALFRLAEDRAGASMREALLTVVVEFLLSLDVEIKWEDILDVPTGEVGRAQLRAGGLTAVGDPWS